MARPVSQFSFFFFFHNLFLGWIVDDDGNLGSSIHWVKPMTPQAGLAPA